MNKIKNVILSLVFTATLIAVMPLNSSLAADCTTAVCNPSTNFFISLPNNTFEGLLIFIIKALISIAGILAVLFIIIGGFQYITSRGSEEQAESGKKTLTNAIIGLVIVILSYVLVAVVANVLTDNIK